MTMTVGCFALIDPFSSLDHQLDRIKDWGFHHADVTDNGDGGSLLAEYGYAAVASLDGNPFDLKRQFDERGLTITSYCAHANLLDPTAPWRYGTAQIVKAVRAAAAIGVPHVITTEGEAHTPFAAKLSDKEAILIVAEKLYEPLRVAADHGVKILLEPHGYLTDSIEHTERLLEVCNSDALALNLDTGNVWLGGCDPTDYIERFGTLIEHVHWKDMPAELEASRGTVFGAGMGLIPLGAGVIGIRDVYHALVKVGFSGHTTLEIAGDEAVLASRAYLDNLAEAA